MHFINIYSSILSCIILSVCCLDRISDVHSFSKKFAGSAISTGRWHLMGDAFITDGSIVLTPDKKSQAGGVWALEPVRFPDWEVEMEYQVKAKGEHLFGDGIVLWYVDDPKARGNVFGYKDYFKGMGLFLDTYDNHNGQHSHSHPYLSLMVNDGSAHYDHDRDGTHTQAAGCEFQFRHATNSAFIKLQYKDGTMTLWKRMSNANYVECFSVKDVQLPTYYYFGLTAATGDLSDEHKIISFRLTALNADKPLDLNKRYVVPKAATSEHERAHIPGKQISRFRKYIKVIFISFIVLGAIIGAVWLIGFYYQEQQRRNKRFY